MAGERQHGLEKPKTPAQMYALIAGAFLTALGVLGLIITGVEFDSVGDPGSGEEFILWATSGWTTIMWIAFGAAGLATMINADAARNYSLIAGVFFTVIAVWGFIDGNDVASIIIADTTNNVTHAVLGGLGLVIGLPSGEQQRDTLEGDPKSMRQQRFRRPSEGAPPAADSSRYPTGVDR